MLTQDFTGQLVGNFVTVFICLNWYLLLLFPMPIEYRIYYFLSAMVEKYNCFLPAFNNTINLLITNENLMYKFFCNSVCKSNIFYSWTNFFLIWLCHSLVFRIWQYLTLFFIPELKTFKNIWWCHPLVFRIWQYLTLQDIWAFWTPTPTNTHFSWYKDSLSRVQGQS
jgi:hypothetical protein